MIKFAGQDAKIRREAFIVAAQMMKMNEAVIEKDFYVVLVLEILFHHSRYGNRFGFKGGTSLSKAYSIIKRFSEDIDVVMDWSLLGLTDKEAWQERSNRQQDMFNRKINIRAGEWIGEKLVPDLRNTFDQLGLSDFDIYVRKEDMQTIIIEYPRAFTISGILPEIRLEIGPLASWTPIETKSIKSYVSGIIPDFFENTETKIPTVEAKRTFWEKATILHKEANRKNDHSPRRLSRHYYDLYLMAQTEIKQLAFEDLELLRQVVNFKKKFYLDNSAKYDEAIPAKMKLLPKESMIERLKMDYEEMHPMFFSAPPSFDQLMDGLKKLDDEIKRIEK